MFISFDFKLTAVVKLRASFLNLPCLYLFLSLNLFELFCFAYFKHASELSIIPSDYFLSIVKDKLVPSMVSVIVRENQSGSSSVFVSFTSFFPSFCICHFVCTVFPIVLCN